MKHPEGKLIKMLREQSGLTLTEVGRKTELSITALSKVENGEARVISKQSRRRLLNVLTKAIEQHATRELRELLDARRFVNQHYPADPADPMRAAIRATFTRFLQIRSLTKAFGKERKRMEQKLVAELFERLEAMEQEENAKATK